MSPLVDTAFFGKLGQFIILMTALTNARFLKEFSVDLLTSDFVKILV